jgi:outer membrane protein OmpA-like peptidoglycan-associated protein
MDQAKEGRQMRNIIRRAGRIGAAVGVASLLSGCGLSSVGGPPGGSATGSAVTITQDVDSSALLAVMTSPASGPPLSALVASTARPREDVRLLQAGAPAATIVASDSPAPTQITVPGPPVAPGGGETAYQLAQYTKRLKAWRAERAADEQAEAVQTRERISEWLDGLGMPQKISRLADPPGEAGGLAAESAVAASALADMEEAAGDVFGTHRVIVLFCDDLGDGAIPAGELTGDDVLVVTGYLPTAAAASAAQADLLEAGAAQAAVVGPEVTAAELAALVSADLSQGAGGDSVSAPVLFGNDSYALSAAAVRKLTGLLPRLREPGATAVINGFASTPGTAQANYILSYQRATAVADFFESRDVPAASLVIAGHGATDLVGSGASGANRRVLVVIEEASGGS